MGKSQRKPFNFEESFMDAAQYMLQDAYVECNLFGNSESISVFTPNKLALKFKLEIMYKYSADKNGALPIISAVLTTVDRPCVSVSHSMARKLICMCYRAQQEQK